MTSKYFVVWKGRQTGIFTSWEECKKQVEGFSGASYKSFKTLEEAKFALKHPDKLKNTNEFIADDYPAYGICVDAAYSSLTKQMEYRGVLLHEKVEIFKNGPINKATNNVGEFLAIVHALALCKKNNWDFPIFSDSRTAIIWVLYKKVNTKLERNNNNEYLFELIKRAENWLKENEYSNKIYKWDTNKWGEIPADFGRK